MVMVMYALLLGWCFKNYAVDDEEASKQSGLTLTENLPVYSSARGIVAQNEVAHIVCGGRSCFAR